MDTEGNINITLNNSPLLIHDDSHATFNSFVMASCWSGGREFKPRYWCCDIKSYQVQHSIKVERSWWIEGKYHHYTMDVTGGMTNHIDLAITVTNLNTSDLTLQLLRSGSVISTTLLPNLSLTMGNNKLETIGSFTPNLNLQGQQTLNDFIGGKDITITIAGFDGSMQVASLLDVFKTLNIDATLPALNSSLLETASLQSTNFDLPSFMDKAFTQLQSDIKLTSAVSIGDYATSLQFTQSSVPVKTDESLNMLLTILAQPIVQKIITGSELSINTVIISNPQQTSFVTALKGSITNAGPFDAEIDFGPGLTIVFSDNLWGDVGATCNVTATFNVADVDHLTVFTKTLLTKESFTWDISGSNLTVNALGISVPSVVLTTKSVNLKDMNGLKGGVTIDSFNLPVNNPAGDVHLTLQTTITNPSQVGIELSSLAFNNFVGSTLLGLIAASDTFTLAPQSTFKLPLVGRLIKQDSDSGLAAVSQVFTDFIHGKDTNVTVMGASTELSDVTWQNKAIMSLSISAVLPSQGKLDVIKSINLDQMESEPQQCW
ncbi:hypothetical protein M422DRAFT_244581 [Sphaerobolus stellatus SS14]|nr:hypothetical protein M422DRAFT_244581 [Sphaerobolus stellatus SS14]